MPADSPAPAPDRIASLDGLRGVAVLGILLMNMIDFAQPGGAYFNPAALGPPSPADVVAWAGMAVLVDGKMRALFSLLFGASTLIVVRRAAAAGRDPVRVHGARMLVLGGFGIAHAVLLWPGDILLLYAMVGMAALPFTEAGTRTLRRAALLLLLLQAALQGWFLLLEVQTRAAAQMPGAAAAMVQAWREIAAAVGVAPPGALAAEIATYRGGWGGIVAHNAHRLSGGWLFQLVFDGPETLAFMLIGMAALRGGLLERPGARARRAALAGLALGWGASALLAWGAARSGFDTIATFAASTLGGLPLRPLLALSMAVLLARWLARAGAAPLRAAGRLAFSNYLLTSLAMCGLFYGWGLGWYARLDRIEALALVPVAWAVMLGWSMVWARRYRYGPLEWLWRSLARGAWQPMRRATRPAGAADR